MFLWTSRDKGDASGHASAVVPVLLAEKPLQRHFLGADAVVEELPRYGGVGHGAKGVQQHDLESNGPEEPAAVAIDTQREYGMLDLIKFT